MKKTLIAGSIAAMLFAGTAFAKDLELKTDDQKLSYSLGMMIGERVLKQYSENIDYDVLITAIRSQHKGEKTQMSMEDAHKEMQASEARATKAKSAAAIANGEKFRAENKKRDGVVETATGLQYEIVTKGDGPKPKSTDKVKVHYKGTLTDGTVFDSSIDRGAPAEFGLNQVIPGWTEGVQLMNTGSKYRFVVPPQMAYGDRGAGRSIGPGETLVFEVELLEIVK